MRIGFFVLELSAYHSHIRPLVDTLSSAKHSCVVFHLSSLYGFRTLPEDSRVTFRSLTRTVDLGGELKECNLDWLVVLNVEHFYVMTLVRIARSLGIITAYWQHGIRPDLTIVEPDSLTQGKFHLRGYVDALRKYAFFYTVSLVSALISSERSVILRLIGKKTKQLLLKTSEALLQTSSFAEARCDVAFVYARRDRLLLRQHYGYEDGQIIEMGYPLDIPQCRSVNPAGGRTVLYISQPVRYHPSLPKDRRIASERAFFDLLTNAAQAAGLTLVVKLHPRESVTEISAYVRRDAPVQIVSNGTIYDLTAASSVVIGHYSTALFYAVVLRKPLLILEAGGVPKFPIDFAGRGAGKYAKREDLASAIAEFVRNPQIDLRAYESFEREFIGTASRSPYELALDTFARFGHGS